MKTYIIAGFALLTITSLITPFDAEAGMFNWFSAKKIAYQQAPLTAFVGQNIGIGSWEDVTEDKKAELANMQLIQQTAIIAIANPVATKKVPVKTGLKTYTITATAYSSTIDQTDDSPFITARGTHVRDGIIAANFLPFGTIVRIPDMFGDKTFVVEDRMHTRFSDRIDIWFPTRQEALEFGAQRVKIEVVS